MVTYTEEELVYREDLTQKLLTLEHAKSVLIGRGDAPLFINQLTDLQNLVQGWMNQAVQAKQQQESTKDGGQPPTGKPEPDQPDETPEDE
jgi:hypothetical protein